MTEQEERLDGLACERDARKCVRQDALERERESMGQGNEATAQ